MDDKLNMDHDGKRDELGSDEPVTMDPSPKIPEDLLEGSEIPTVKSGDAATGAMRAGAAADTGGGTETAVNNSGVAGATNVGSGQPGSGIVAGGSYGVPGSYGAQGQTGFGQPVNPVIQPAQGNNVAPATYPAGNGYNAGNMGTSGQPGAGNTWNGQPRQPNMQTPPPGGPVPPQGYRNQTPPMQPGQNPPVKEKKSFRWDVLLGFLLGGMIFGLIFGFIVGGAVSRAIKKGAAYAVEALIDAAGDIGESIGEALGDSFDGIGRLEGGHDEDQRDYEFGDGGSIWPFGGDEAEDPEEEEERDEPKIRSNSGYLGIICSNVSDEMAENFGMPKGANIREVTEGSAAEKAGLKKGQIITAVDGEEVGGADDLVRLIAANDAGDRVTLTVYTADNGSYVESEVDVKLGSRPEE